MKKLTLLVVICFTSQICLAQITTTLVVAPQPPAAMLTWNTKHLTFIISNQGAVSGRQAVIKTELKTVDGTVIATTNLAKARVITIPPGSLILGAADVIPFEAMVFTGKYKASIDKTGKLPADNYQLCVQLVTPVDYIPFIEPKCRNFTLASFQLPIPVMPANEEVMDAVKAQTAITFRWTPVAPKPSEMVKYIVTVFEVQAQQTPMQALRSNQPLLTKEVIGTTQFIWQPQLSFTEFGTGTHKNKVEHWGDPHENPKGKMVMDSIDATTFIWTIQTTDLQGRPIGDGNINGDGISEPNFFTVISDRRKNPLGPPARVLYLNRKNND